MELKEITSQQNTKIKYLKKLSQKKYRRKNKEFFVENLTTIYDALKSGHIFRELFVTQNFINKHRKEFEYFKKEAGLNECYLMNEHLNKQYSQLDTPSGITAVYSINSSPLDQTSSVVYLNGIKDPGNMGTIMRSALAFDVCNIVLDLECVDVYNFKVIGAAKDSIFKVNIIEDIGGKWLEEHKGILSIYVANSHQGIEVSDVNGCGRYCLVLGSEGHGISKEIIALADKQIRIDISDNIESLNVSSVAAILFHGLQ
jgi:TrmH family RNA methyltransferase